MSRWLLAAVFCLGLPAHAAQGPEEARRQAFQDIARQIVEGIDATRRSRRAAGGMDSAQAYLREAYDYVQAERLRIAVAPFEQDEIKIAKSVADEFNASLFAALIAKAGRRYDLMARAHLKALIDDMQQTGAWQAADGNPINALLENAGKVDVLIRGRIRVSGQDAVLTYTAIAMDGRLLAQTQPRRFHLSPEDAKITRPTVGLDRAIAAAAKNLAGQAPGLNELLLAGVRFEDSGAQPPFGRYVQGRLSAAMGEEYGNVVTGRNIKVNRLRARTGLSSGGAVRGKDLSDRNLGGKAAAHVLSGSYWELPGAIELRLELQGPGGASAAWVGWIEPGDTAGRRIRPKGDFGNLRDNDGLGPFAFHLTSDRGKNAAYAIGDHMQLLIRLDREAWVYCFYRDAAGATIQILPNPHFWQNHRQANFKGGVLYTVPEESRFNFEFTVQPPTGQELVKCFAVSRDVTADLPAALQGRTLAPMPRDLAMQLPAAFHELPDTAVSEASFVVTVSE
ncbi:MAG: DUF4384 domain-containing protein [Alphaproteobacteria bacterium]|jgi:hypothetical protein|nr:DUF4384 domain-containing protein [Alphaproteobacteria bacterium]